MNTKEELDNFEKNINRLSRKFEFLEYSNHSRHPESVQNEGIAQGITKLINFSSRFLEYDGFMHTISRVGDPAYAFSIIFPIISTIDTLLAADILLVSVVAEWSNTLLKWILREDRPYWWIRETHIDVKDYPFIRQSHISCETGPGSPSGHVMGCAALLYVLIASFIRHYEKKTTQIGLYKMMAASFWTLYIVLLLFVSISRIYLVTHFPHQCFLGAILGFLIGHFLGRRNAIGTNHWHECTKLRFLLYVLFSTITSGTSYWTQKAFGIDPQWSVKMAFKWCENIENIHVNTTPLFSLCRDTGLSLGLVSVTPITKHVVNKHNLMVSVACVLAYCTALHLAQLSVPTINAPLFYICHHILYSTMPYILLGVIPEFATVKPKTN